MRMRHLLLGTVLGMCLALPIAAAEPALAAEIIALDGASYVNSESAAPQPNFSFTLTAPETISHATASASEGRMPSVTAGTSDPSTPSFSLIALEVDPITGVVPASFLAKRDHLDDEHPDPDDGFMPRVALREPGEDDGDVNDGEAQGQAST